MTTRVLVTGATGFLGRNVLAALTTRGDVTPVAACRTPSTLDPDFGGEVRAGDLRDPAYRRRVVREVDVVCHAGTWGSLWGHREAERTHFFEPARDLVDQAIDAGVERFLLASTLVVGVPDDELGVRGPTGFWPHLDRLIDLETYLRANSRRGTRMISMRLGHFVGAGNRLGLVAALAPRLRTRLVPWLSGGHARLALVADTDLGEAFALAATADRLADHEAFTITGPDFPTIREVITFIAEETGLPLPRYSVPYPAGYAFGWLMERLHRVLPGDAPFLTRSLVYLAEDWWRPTEHATNELGYRPRKDWRTATREALTELTREGLPLAPTRPGGLMPTTTRKIEPGDVLAERELRTITGEPVRLPHPERLTHLQFRRYATCPLCNLHLRSIAQRHDEILAAGIREFGVEATPRALLNPRVWPTAIRAAIHNRRLVPATPNGGILGLPADFLIDTNNHVLDRKYGTHAYDQWTVDELLAHAR